MNSEYKRQWALAHRKPCKECSKLTFSVRLLCASCAKKGKRNPWYGKPSPNSHRKGMVTGQPIGTIITAKNEAYKRIKIGCMKWQRYHRWVVEQHIGRKLLSTEHVHHKNHDQLDNRISNLMILSPSEHGKLHAQSRRVVVPI